MTHFSLIFVVVDTAALRSESDRNLTYLVIGNYTWPQVPQERSSEALLLSHGWETIYTLQFGNCKHLKIHHHQYRD